MICMYTFMVCLCKFILCLVSLGYVSYIDKHHVFLDGSLVGECGFAVSPSLQEGNLYALYNYISYVLYCERATYVSLSTSFALKYQIIIIGWKCASF